MQNRARQYERARWYERDNLPYAADRATVRGYADWVKMVEWKLFCTFTFAGRVSDPLADETFAKFVDSLEKHLRCDVGYVRGDEKRFSGCGKPASGRHFHALLTYEGSINPAVVEWFWTRLAGHRSDDAGALVEPYNPSRNGAEYVLKFINRENGDWAFRKLHLFHPECEPKMNSRMRRHLLRHPTLQFGGTGPTSTDGWAEYT